MTTAERRKLHYTGYNKPRVEIRPGIDGMRQGSGRNDVNDFENIVEMKLSYIDNWSLWLDAKILRKGSGRDTDSEGSGVTYEGNYPGWRIRYKIVSTDYGNEQATSSCVR